MSYKHTNLFYSQIFELSLFLSLRQKLQLSCSFLRFTSVFLRILSYTFLITSWRHEDVTGPTGEDV